MAIHVPAADCRAQFHQSQAGDRLPLVPTNPTANTGQAPFLSDGRAPISASPFPAELAPQTSGPVTSGGDPRRDSTVLGVRPLTTPAPPRTETGELQQFQGLPVRTSLTSGMALDTGESEREGAFFGEQQPSILQPPGGLIPRAGSGTGLDPRLSQDPSQGASGWRGTTGGLGGSGQVANPPPLNSPVGSGGLAPQIPSFGGGLGNPTSATLPGEQMAPGSRLLPADQVDRSRTASAVAARQAAFASLDPSISLPDLSGATNQALRSGRSSRFTDSGSRSAGSGMDDFPESQPAERRRDLDERPTTNGQTVRQVSDSQDRESRDANGVRTPSASMDAFSWWLMMCSVLANAILFYFLYDSRAKYLNLADELQSRFFRES